MSNLFQPYPDWKPSPGSRLNISTDREFARWGDENGVLHMEPSGRMRVTIEGEADLVKELLGKNYSKRAHRVARMMTR